MSTVNMSSDKNLALSNTVPGLDRRAQVSSKPVWWVFTVTLLSVILSWSTAQRASLESVKAATNSAVLSSTYNSIQLVSRYTEFNSLPQITRFVESDRPKEISFTEAHTIHPDSDYQWVEVSFSNPGTEPKPVYLHINYPNLGEVRIFRLQDHEKTLVQTWGDGKNHAGYARTAALSVQIDKGETATYGFQVYSPERSYYSLFVTDRAAFLQNANFLLLSYTLFNGVHIVMLLFGISFAAGVKLSRMQVNVDYVAYFCIYLMGSILYMLNFDGSMASVFPQNLIEYRVRGSVGMIALWAYIQFILCYLDYSSERNRTWIKTCLKGTQWLTLLYIPLAFITPINIQFYLSISIFLLITALALVSALHRYAEKNHKAQYVLIAWAHKFIVILQVPMWLYAGYEFDINEFQFSIRFAWGIEFVAIAAAICMKMKLEVEEKVDRITATLAGNELREKKKEVVRGIIHDIKTPIANLYTAADQLLNETMYPDTNRRFSLIRGLSWDALHQILLGFEQAKNQSGHGGGLIYVSEFCPIEIADKIYEVLEEQIIEKNVALDFVISEDITGYCFRGDETRIFYIIENAILESLSQVDIHHITVTLNCLSNDSSLQLICSIEDDSSHTTNLVAPGQHSPLENAIEHLIALGGYEISGSSQNGFVSTRVLYIPIEDRILKANNRKTSNLRVLFVEDQHEMWEHIDSAFNASEQSIEFCSSIKKARVAISSTQYNVIIVDGNLPDGSAEELITIIRNSDINRKARIICYSADESTRFVEHIRGIGADQFVGKSAGLAYLRRQVHSAQCKQGPTG